MGSFWNKVVFKFGKTKVKVWHLGALLIIGLLFYQFNAPLQFSPFIRGTTVKAELGSLQTTSPIANSARTTVSGKFDLSGSSSRVEPDDANGGLPDLQLSLKDFSVSSATKDKEYHYTSDGTRYKATVSLHDFSYTIKVECESDRNILGDTESQYYWYAVDLYMPVKAEGGWVGFEKVSISDVRDDSNQVDLGDVKIYDDVKVDYSKVGSGQKSPDNYGLTEKRSIILRINKADDNSGKDSYTATAKISGRVVIVTSKVSSGGDSGDSGDGDDGYTPPPIDEYGLGDLSDIVTLLGISIVGVFVILVILVIFAISRKR